MFQLIQSDKVFKSIFHCKNLLTHFWASKDIISYTIGTFWAYWIFFCLSLEIGNDPMTHVYQSWTNYWQYDETTSLTLDLKNININCLSFNRYRFFFLFFFTIRVSLKEQIIFFINFDCSKNSIILCITCFKEVDLFWYKNNQIYLCSFLIFLDMINLFISLLNLDFKIPPSSEDNLSIRNPAIFDWFSYSQLEELFLLFCQIPCHFTFRSCRVANISRINCTFSIEFFLFIALSTLLLIL